MASGISEPARLGFLAHALTSLAFASIVIAALPSKFTPLIALAVFNLVAVAALPLPVIYPLGLVAL